MRDEQALIKSKRRVVDHGEVFTPPWMVEAMLDGVKGETERVESRFLEPACGSGNFLVPILRRKLAAVERACSKTPCERRCVALLAVMSIYGIELLADNAAECRANMLATLADHFRLGPDDELYRATSYVLAQNIVHGDALAMRTKGGGPITFAEWRYLGRGEFGRRDFRFADLVHAAPFNAPGSLFAGQGRQESAPVRVYPPVTMQQLAASEGDA